MKLTVGHGSNRPLYKQITQEIEKAVRSGELAPGARLPSMNELAASLSISRETVKKAYGILSDRGIIRPRHGMGFFVNAPDDSSAPVSILLLFDKLSIYKQVIFNSFAAEIGDRAEMTILNHNQSLDLLNYYLDNNLDDFDYYVITPHFPQDEASQAQALRLVSRIPNRKLIMLDRLIPGFSGNFGAVYQDFDNDVYYGLAEGLDKLRSSSALKVVTLPESLYGTHIRRGVERFCKDFSVRVQFFDAVPETLQKGDTFLLLNSQVDASLVELSHRISDLGLKVGNDVRIISYNEFELNEVMLGGLTTISTDFPEMGKIAARMILDRNLSKVHCPFRMTRRSTF